MSNAARPATMPHSSREAQPSRSAASPTHSALPKKQGLYDPAFEQQMEAARKVMKKRRNVLRELAK